MHIDVGSGAEDFVWNVYTEMLEVVESELGVEGFQARNPRIEYRDLLVEGVNSTHNYPFLEMYVDPEGDCLIEGTIVHETAHHVVEQAINEHFPRLTSDSIDDIDKQFILSDNYTDRSRYEFDTETAAQKIELLYIDQSKHLDDLGIKDELMSDAEEANHVENGGILEEFKHQ